VAHKSSAARISVIAALVLGIPAVAWPRVLVWAVLPAVLALAVLAVSVRSMIRHRGPTQALLGLPAVSLSILSLWTLKRMLVDGAWATYFPYVGIALAMSFAIVQSQLARSSRSPVRDDVPIPAPGAREHRVDSPSVPGGSGHV
jgi:hypothetical protein